MRLNTDQITQNEWFKSMNVPIVYSRGSFVGQSQIDYEPCVLKELEKFNFDQNLVKMTIDANQHNHITTFYFILLNKWKRSGLL